MSHFCIELRDAEKLEYTGVVGIYEEHIDSEYILLQRVWLCHSF